MDLLEVPERVTKNMPSSEQLTIEQALSRAKNAITQGNTAIALKLYNAVLQQLTYFG